MTIDEKSLAALDAYFKQWQQIAERVRAQVTPVFKVQEPLQKSPGPIIEAQKAFQKALEPILTEQNRWRKFVESIKVPHSDLPDLLPLAKQVAEFQNSLQGLMSPAFEQLQRIFRFVLDHKVAEDETIHHIDGHGPRQYRRHVCVKGQANRRSMGGNRFVYCYPGVRIPQEAF